MADSGGTGSSSPWWKSLTNSKKKSKENAVGAQAQAQTDPDLEDPLSASPEWISSSQDNPDGSGEILKSDKLGGEKSGNSRRNLKISRSGRFKEKRKMRATLLPEEDRSPDEADFPLDQQEGKQ